MSRILVVHDNKELLDYLRSLLVAGGHVVETARDGTEALDAARRAPTDLIISGPFVPKIGSSTLLDHWKADPRLREVPFFVYTAACSEAEHVQIARSFGADAFVLNDSDPDGFLAHVRDALRNISRASKVIERPSGGKNALIKIHHDTPPRALGQKALQLDAVSRDLGFEIAEDMRPEEVLRLLTAVVLQSTESILITDAKLDVPGPRIVFVNPAFTRMTGYQPSEVIGKTPRMLHGPATDRKVLQRLREELPRKHVFSGEAIMYRKDGTEYVQQWNIAPILNAGGVITHYAAVQRDVTELRSKKRRIERLDRVREVISSIRSTLIRVHSRDDFFREVCLAAFTHGTFALAWFGEEDQASQQFKSLAVACNAPNCEGISGIPDGLMCALSEIGRRALRTQSPAIVNDFEGDPTLMLIEKCLNAHGHLSAAAYPLITCGRTDSVFILFATEPNFFKGEEVELLNWLADELSYALEHLENAQRLAHLTYFDALTELANAKLFRNRLGQFVIAAHKTGQKVCVLVFDLEDFTGINDAFGHASGDELLREVSDRLRVVFPEPMAIGRIGADAFAVACPADNELVARRLCKEIGNIMARPFSIGGRSLVVLAHAGIAIYPDDSDDENNVFKHAEFALKLCKSSDKYCMYYSAEMSARVAERTALEKELRRAVAEGQFILHYQPRLDMINGRVVGAEALIRWQHPTKGLVEPVTFIALAEEMGLIVAIGAWVINQLCAQQSKWLDAGVPVVPIAANVSAAQLEESDLIAIVRAALARHSVDPCYLHLELTESVVMNDTTTAAEVLSGLRNLGIRLALDDFGTGYSSLAQLKRLPFDYVKIDRAFVAEITHSAEDSAIALAVISIAERMGLKVVAEGVETKSQFNYLLKNGCHEMQGHYFSPAIDEDAFETLLRSGRGLIQEEVDDSSRPCVLVVDDERGIRSALSRILRRDGYHVLTASNGSAALELLALNAVQVIIADQRMPEMSGTEFLSLVKDLYPDTMRIILSGYSDLKVVTDSVNRGAVFRFLTKPWDDEMLRDQVRDAFRRYVPKEQLNKPLNDETRRNAR